MPATSPTSVAAIREEILGGLTNERERLDDALFNVEFYEGDFSRFPPRSADSAYDSGRYPRCVPLMQRIVNVLTDNLYRQGPARTLPDHPEAADWLNAVYKRCGVDALWQAADQMAAATRVAAFQVLGCDDPDCPIEVTLWDGSQFCAWVHPDKPLAPIAVATIDLFDNRRRIRLWTNDEVTTFVTDKWNPGMPNGATAYAQLGPAEPNPYGVIPFSFVHWKKPVRDFWTSSPGNLLRQINDGGNFFLTENFDGVRYSIRPVVVLKNVRAGWKPPKPVRPGDVWDLPGDGDATEQAGRQDASYLQSDPGFIGASWEDFQNYLDLVLEMEGIPRGTIRMDGSAFASGVAIVAEQLPLLLWAESRQRPFADYELALARLVLAVGAAHLGAQDFAEYRATSAKLEAAARDPGLLLRWPDMFPDLPGEARDRSDQWLLDNGLSSRTTILMRRDKLTREEAEAKLAEVAADLRREQGLFGDQRATPTTPAGGDRPTLDETDPTDETSQDQDEGSDG